MPKLLLSLLFLFSLSACVSDGNNSSKDDPAVEPQVVGCDANLYQQPSAVSLEKLPLDQSFPLVTSVEFLPSNNGSFLVTQQTGEISLVEKNQAGYSTQLLLNLSDHYDLFFSPEAPGSCHECGLYSVAFHPNFSENGWLYASFTEGGSGDQPLHSYAARFVFQNGAISLEDSGAPVRQNIYHAEQPSRIHNNGKIRFGPDNYLYMSFGDGGYDRHSQDPATVFGSIIRLTDEGEPAPGNLVIGGLEEVYALGFRNPWSWSFDRETGQLWVGDVGNWDVEEVNLVENGKNYGWPCFEGNRQHKQCPTDLDYIEPVSEYHHVEGKAVTGGYVYRGHALPELEGHFIFGDFISGVVWSLSKNADNEYQRLQLVDSGKNISSFAQDHDGEIFVLDYVAGELLKIVPFQADIDAVPLPNMLKNTGCINPDDESSPAPGLIPYDVIEPLWSDGATKERFVSLPKGEKITVENDGDFDLPEGSILVKNFRLNGKIIETRLLLNQQQTGWIGYSYQWNDTQTEAYLLDGALDVNIDGQQWHYPSSSECRICHTAAAGFSLGLEVAQLNRNYSPSTAHGKGNILLDWQEQGLFEHSIDHHLNKRLVNSDDLEQTLEARARSYLHVNCSQCHRPGGTTQAFMDFRYTTHLPQSNACAEAPNHEHADFVDSLLLKPGVSDQSILYQRLSSRGEYQMPPLGTNLVDDQGSTVLKNWINSMDVCRTVLGPVGTSFSVRNRASNLYLGASLTDLELHTVVGNNSAMWLLQPTVESYYQIQNKATTSNYLHTETPELHLGEAPEYWLSAMWELVPAKGGYLIRNRWKGNLYIQVIEQKLELSPLSSNIETAVWEFTEGE